MISTRRQLKLSLVSAIDEFMSRPGPSTPQPSLSNAKQTVPASPQATSSSTISSAASSKPSTSSVPSTTRTLDGMYAGSDVLRAEILWAMKCVDSHYSYNSCSSINRLFLAMFPDSTIAKSFGCSERKASYLCTFGLAPYFACELRKNAPLCSLV